MWAQNWVNIHYEYECRAIQVLLTAWLKAGMTHKKFLMCMTSKVESVSALFRRSNFKSSIVPRFTPAVSGHSEENLECWCNWSVEFVDLFGYHMSQTSLLSTITTTIWLITSISILHHPYKHQLFVATGKYTQNNRPKWWSIWGL